MIITRIQQFYNINKSNCLNIKEIALNSEWIINKLPEELFMCINTQILTLFNMNITDRSNWNKFALLNNLTNFAICDVDGCEYDFNYTTYENNMMCYSYDESITIPENITHLHIVESNFDTINNIPNNITHLSFGNLDCILENLSMNLEYIKIIKTSINMSAHKFPYSVKIDN